MSIEVTKRTEHEVHTHALYLEFEGAEPMAWSGFTHKGKSVVPVRAKAAYRHGEPIEQITLTVKVCKKGGTVGNIETKERFETPHSKVGWNSKWSINAPAWLLEIFGIEAV